MGRGGTLQNETDGLRILPARFGSTEELDDFLSRPDAALLEDMTAGEGDIIILSPARNIAPTLARRGRHAVHQHSNHCAPQFSGTPPTLRLTS